MRFLQHIFGAEVGEAVEGSVLCTRPTEDAEMRPASPSEQASQSDSFAQRASGKAFVSTGGRSAARRLALLATLASFAFLLVAGSAAASPVYGVKATWGSYDLPPGGEGQFDIQARNVSEETGAKKITIIDALPAGVKVKAIRWLAGIRDLSEYCSGVGSGTVTCELKPVVKNEAGEEEELLPKYAPGRGIRVPLGTSNAEPHGYLPLIEVDIHVTAAPPANPGANKVILLGGSGALPDGQPCAQLKAELPTLPPCAEDADPIPFGTEPIPFGLVPESFLADFFDAEFPRGAPTRTAGAHPFELRTNFDIKGRLTEGRQYERVVSAAPLKTVEFTLPRGVIGNPEALPKCDPVRFAEVGSTLASTACPANTQVGYINVLLPTSGARNSAFLVLDGSFSRLPLYSLVPPKGQVADFAFSGFGSVQAHIYPVLDPAQDYAVKTLTPDITTLEIPRGSEVTVWGVPGDPAHDLHRYYPEAQPSGEKDSEGREVMLAAGAPFGGAPIRPFFTNPMDCGFENGGAKISIDSYLEPGNFTTPEEYGDHDNVEEESCKDPRFRFEPEIKLAPTDQHAGAATGLKVNLEVPQRSDVVKEAKDLYEGSTAVEAVPTPPIKKTVVTFPEGMTVNPSAAQGLGSCTLKQIGIELREGRFVPNDNPVTCPDSSQYGTLTLHTPLLPIDAQPKGFIYIARQNENPFPNPSLLALYLVIQEPDRGLLFKIPGRVELDETTGQIKTTFDNLPQFPVSDMEMNLKSGVRAGLVEPQTCGEKTIEATFYTWQDPTTPHPVKDHYNITQKADGSPCVNNPSERPFDPQLTAGTLNPIAGSFSPLALRMTRTDEDQELSAVEGTAPPGLTASLAGIAQCSQAQIEAAQAPGRSGTEELNSPSCPASSQVGTVDAGAGVGQALTFVKGKVYLAGPYEGAPASGVAIVPAVAGPFDLGTVVTRAPAYVDPETAQITLKTDPLPQIFKGVPLRTRDIRVHLDRPDFTLNPTSCEEMSFTGTLFSTEGKQKPLENRFQAADCAALGFKPSLTLKLKGGTKRGAHPALTAVLKARAGDANIAGAQVALPRSEFIDNAHFNNICTRVQFKADACPAASVYGQVRAITPLFDEPLQGPVYMRANPAHKLPDLVAALRGPASLPVEVDLAMRVDSFHGGIRTTVEQAPDAPVTEFTLSMQGGKKGLLENSENLCTGTFRATARFTAQNGRAITLRPALKATSCKGKGRKGGRHRGKGRRARHR